MSKTIGELHTDLEQAGKSYESARQRASMARNEEADARNKLNQAQKAFDAAVAEMKKQAPCDSDWKRTPGLPERANG